jgi:redox-sensitive bicupin YhaK (pirin superfamily)
MGLLELPGGAGQVRVIAGQYRGVRGPAKTHTPLGMFDVRLSAGGRAEFSFPARENAALLVMKGDVRINRETVASDNEFVLFENEGERVEIEAESPAQVLVLNGEPIGEPVVSYGPFVMNTTGEIRRAMADFQEGKFGYLED